MRYKPVSADPHLPETHYTAVPEKQQSLHNNTDGKLTQNVSVALNSLEDNSLQNTNAVLVLNGDDRHQRSKKLFMVIVALAGALSISSVGWMFKKSNLVHITAPQKKAIASVPVITPTTILPVTEKKSTLPAIDKEKEARKKWSDLITVGSSNYAYGVLGGITNLSVVFTNRTDYMMDEMTAMVTFIKSNGKPWKTKSITLFSIPPHSTRSQSVPKVNRGKSVEVELSSAISRKMHFSYQQGKATRGEDPYRTGN